MASVSVVQDNILNIRCPYCLKVLNVPKNIPTTKKVTCDRCQKIFEFKNALAYKKSSNIENAIQSTYNKKISSGHVNVFGIFIMTLALVGTAFWMHNFGKTLDGPTFLFYYLLFYGITCAAVFFVKKLWIQSVFISFIGGSIYALVGFERIRYGTELGMEKFDFLYTMIFLGAFLLIMAHFSSHETTRGSSDSGGFFGFGGCSSCSSCGGGCGGGGCGGCG